MWGRGNRPIVWLRWTQKQPADRVVLVRGSESVSVELPFDPKLDTPVCGE